MEYCDSGTLLKNITIAIRHFTCPHVNNLYTSGGTSRFKAHLTCPRQQRKTHERGGTKRSTRVTSRGEKGTCNRTGHRHQRQSLNASTTSNEPLWWTQRL